MTLEELAAKIDSLGGYEFDTGHAGRFLVAAAAACRELADKRMDGDGRASSSLKQATDAALKECE